MEAAKYFRSRKNTSMKLTKYPQLIILKLILQKIRKCRGKKLCKKISGKNNLLPLFLKTNNNQYIILKAP